MAQITNAQVATAADLVGLTPVVPLLETVDNTDPNEDTAVGFVDGNGNRIVLTYTELTGEDVNNLIAAQLLGDFPDRVTALVADVATFAAAVAALTEPYDYADYKVIADGLREFRVWKGYY